MKRYYKTKKTNITKLKTYLKDAIKTNNKGCGRSAGSKHSDTKHHNVH